MSDYHSKHCTLHKKKCNYGCPELIPDDDNQLFCNINRMVEISDKGKSVKDRQLNELDRVGKEATKDRALFIKEIVELMNPELKFTSYEASHLLRSNTNWKIYRCANKHHRYRYIGDR